MLQHVAMLLRSVLKFKDFKIKHYKNFDLKFSLVWSYKYEGCGWQIEVIAQSVMPCCICFCLRNFVCFYFNVFSYCIGGGMWE
jgi:hypothetical protein